MWYFAWVLGLAMAALFAVVNAMWLEFQHDRLMAAGTPVDDDAFPTDAAPATLAGARRRTVALRPRTGQMRGA